MDVRAVSQDRTEFVNRDGTVQAVAHSPEAATALCLSIFGRTPQELHDAYEPQVATDKPLLAPPVATVTTPQQSQEQLAHLGKSQSRKSKSR